ncbi:putative DNA-binding protein [Nostocoides japonicum T1-X7]|uniref:Putative DNA-binding protein n=1 Tax=Nostocoides japonicum T1-X7 TaxID=1194083 RepID=A0A077M463_9MICO|nr:LacI family DNA-binding transcriptional regulator [Tetrasphaera japonica]CCH78925.1 putative DNA-binding protein [Tetrasphaera japonica T1-X7]
MSTRGGGHRIADIASQSGLSAATVDRVLHGRPGASARAVHQVEQAVLDLDRQRTQLRLGARTLVVDVVMQAPVRFSGAVREALERELPALRPATVRARFHLSESAGPQDVASLVAHLDRIGTRGRSSQGVLLKAPDDPEVAGAIDRLASRGIPVVTLVTDVRESRRVAYVGLDNAAAGATAAYLVAGWTGSRSGGRDEVAARGRVLVTLSRATFFGEQERRAAFEDTVRRLAPGLEVLVLSDADGLDEAMAALVRRAVTDGRAVDGVYSIGGGNRAIAAELAAAGVVPDVFIGHDLDADNLELLRTGVLTAVLHHDLRADMRRACQQVMRHHHLLPGAPTSRPAAVQIITPHNVPPRLGPAG